MDFALVDFGYLDIKFGSKLVAKASNHPFDDLDKKLFSEWLEGFGMDHLGSKPEKSLVLYHSEHGVASMYAVRLAMSLLRRRRKISHVDLGSDTYRIPSGYDVCFLSMPKFWSLEAKASTAASIRTNNLFTRYVITTSDLFKTYAFVQEIDFYSYFEDDFWYFDLTKRSRVKAAK